MSTPDRILRFDPRSPVPAYRQIFDGLRRHLVAGRFQPGERLPPVRNLARDLGIHHNTVAEAYRHLADEGWIQLVRGRGATVVAREAPSISSSDLEAFDPQLDAWLAGALADGADPSWLRELLTRKAAAFSSEESKP